MGRRHPRARHHRQRAVRSASAPISAPGARACSATRRSTGSGSARSRGCTTRCCEIGKPTIARINGICVGGGNELQMACDLSVIVDDAYIRHVGLEHGSVPAGGATQWLTLMVGERRAREIILLCEEIPARRRAEWGLVNYAVPARGAGRRRRPLGRVARAQAARDDAVREDAAERLARARVAPDRRRTRATGSRCRCSARRRSRAVRAFLERAARSSPERRDRPRRARRRRRRRADEPAEALNALSGELMGARRVGAAGARRATRRSAASSSAATSARSRPAPTSASSPRRRRSRSTRTGASTSWDVIRDAAHAARRGRLRLLPRRRLRARDDVRPDRRVRDGAVRPAGDQPRRPARAPAARSG